MNADNVTEVDQSSEKKDSDTNQWERLTKVGSQEGGDLKQLVKKINQTVKQKNH